MNRQLAGLVAPVIGALAPTRLVAPQDDVPAALRHVGWTSAEHAVTSPDATPAARDFAMRAEQVG